MSEQETKAEQVKQGTKKQFEWQKVRYAFVRPILYIVLRCMGCKTRVYHRIKGPYLVLANHTHPMDAMMMGVAFTEPVHVVAASAIFKGAGGRWLDFFAHPIHVEKAAIDMAGLRRMMAEAKKGHSIGLYPEGNVTIDGSPLPYDRAVAKLVKMLKMKVVLYRTRGGYMKLPKWAAVSRRGTICGEVVDVISAEDVASLSMADLYDRIRAGIDYDIFADEAREPVAYPSPRAAEGVERLLYFCPACGGRADFTSKGHTFTCSACGAAYEMDDFGHISGPYANTALWNAWQMQVVAAEQDPTRYAVAGTLYRNNAPEPVAEGTLTPAEAGLTIGGLTFTYAEIDGVVLHASNHILISIGADEYHFAPADDEHDNVLPLLWSVESRLHR